MEVRGQLYAPCLGKEKLLQHSNKITESRPCCLLTPNSGFSRTGFGTKSFQNVFSYLNTSREFESNVKMVEYAKQTVTSISTVTSKNAQCVASWN